RFGDLAEDLGQVELREALHLDRDDAEDDAHRAALAEDRGAEARAARERVGDVELAERPREVDRRLAPLEDELRDRLGVGGPERRHLDRAEELAGEAVMRRIPGLEVDVAHAALDPECEELVKGRDVHLWHLTVLSSSR